MRKTRTTQPATAPKRQVELFSVRNSMGGRFDGYLTGKQVEDCVEFRVYMPSAGDWHGHTFALLRDALTPLNKTALVAA